MICQCMTYYIHIILLCLETATVLIPSARISPNITSLRWTAVKYNVVLGDMPRYKVVADSPNTTHVTGHYPCLRLIEVEVNVKGDHFLCVLILGLVVSEVLLCQSSANSARAHYILIILLVRGPCCARPATYSTVSIDVQLDQQA